MRRQAKLDPEDYLVMAEDLMGFALEDVEEALDKLGKTEREAGETAFPSVGTMLAACNKVRERKFIKRESAARDAAYEAKQRHMREHPEEYVTGVKL